MNRFTTLFALLASFFRRKPTPPAPPAPPVVPPVPTTATDLAAADLAPVNQLRQLRGRPPLAFDVRMYRISAANNIVQANRGEGHWVEPAPPYGQCSDVGVTSAQSAADAWRDSAEHYPIIMDPSYRFGGLAINLETGFATLTMRP